MLIYGFDVATATGVAIWDTDKPESSIRAQTLIARGESPMHMAHDLGRQINKLLITNGTPSHVCYEAALSKPVAGSHASALILPVRFAGAIQGVIGCHDISHEEVSISTWRKDIYGFGRKSGFDWKRHAMYSCKQMNIEVGNHNEAEAALIAFWAGRKSKQIKMREHQ